MNQIQEENVASVLVVDDEPSIRKVVATTLSQMGYSETYLAGDAESALELIDRERPDLVISDVLLPGMSGVDLAQRVKSDEALRDTPVLLMSAFGEPAGHQADGFIAKPFDIDALAKFVDPFMP